MASNLIDSIIIFRILKKLTTPWKKTGAYRVGLIDQNGKLLVKKSARTTAQNKHFTLLDRLVFNLKRLLEKTPLGRNQLGSYIAALALIKEHVETTSNTETSVHLIEKLEEHNLIDPISGHDISTAEGFLDAFEDSMIEGMSSGASTGGPMSGAGSNEVINQTGMAGFDAPINKPKKRKNIVKIIGNRL